MRQFIFVLFAALLCFNAHAFKSVMDIAQEGQEAGERLQDLQTDAITVVFDVIIECEMQLICMMDKYEEIKETTDNFILTVMINAMMDEEKERLAWLRANPTTCEIDEMIALRKGMTTCMPALKQALLDADEELASEFVMCFINVVHPMAEDGNLFAIASLAQFYQDTGVDALANRFKKRLDEEAEKNQAHAQLLDKCLGEGSP
jgi:hypothetical protein